MENRRRLADRVPLWLRLVPHAAFWWLIVVWVVHPESPSRFYRTALLGTLGVGVALALWPPSRNACAAFLRKQLRWADLVLVNLFLLIAFAEIGVRGLSAIVDSPTLVLESAAAAERVRHHRYPPHGHHAGRTCNALGLFDEEFVQERKPGVRRIVALGDSFAVGVVSYDDNFLTLLDEQLDREQPTEVLNYGVIAAGPSEYLHLWRTEAVHFDPDVALVCVFVGNDFERVRDKSILHAGTLHSLVVMRRMWLQQSWNPEGTATPLGLMDQTVPSMPESTFVNVERWRAEICRINPTEDTRFGYERAFERFDELCEAIGDKLRVVVIPDMFQVDDELWRKVTGDDAASFDRELPNQKLAAFLEERNVPCLDLLETIRTAHRTAPTYKPCDTHWNSHGNAAAAAAITAWLAAME